MKYWIIKDLYIFSIRISVIIISVSYKKMKQVPTCLCIYVTSFDYHFDQFCIYDCVARERGKKLGETRLVIVAGLGGIILPGCRADRRENRVLTVSSLCNRRVIN